MTKQTDYTVEEVYDSPDKTTYYYVHSPEFDTKQQAEKQLQKIINNQRIVDTLITHYKNGIKLEQTGKSINSVERPYLTATLTYIDHVFGTIGINIKELE